MAPRAGDGPGSSTGPDDGFPQGEPARPSVGQGPHTSEEPGAGARREKEHGEAYARFQEGSRLLDSGNTHAAVVALERARDLEPEKGSIREALARAYFRSGRIAAARAEFEKVVELDPFNDYAHFGLGLAANRAGELRLAAEHLALAVAMRPDLPHYTRALRGVRARQAAGPA